MMAGVTTVCEECEGRRFQASVLDYRLGGLNIAEGARPIGPRCEVEKLLRHRRGTRTPAAHAILRRHGRRGTRTTCGSANPLTTLSGGERQRLQARDAHGRPTAASTCSTSRPLELHLADLNQLLGLPGPASRLRQVGDSDRAPPGGDGARRLDHRPRAGCGPRRRANRVRRHTGRPGGGEIDADRRPSRGIRQQPSEGRPISLSESEFPTHRRLKRVGQVRDGSQGPHRTGTDAGRRTSARRHVREVPRAATASAAFTTRRTERARCPTSGKPPQSDRSGPPFGATRLLPAMAIVYPIDRDPRTAPARA